MNNICLYLVILKLLKTQNMNCYALPVDSLAVVKIWIIIILEFINELNTNVQTFGLNSENNPTCLIKIFKQFRWFAL